MRKILDNSITWDFGPELFHMQYFKSPSYVLVFHHDSQTRDTYFCSTNPKTVKYLLSCFVHVVIFPFSLL